DAGRRAAGGMAEQALVDDQLRVGRRGNGSSLVTELARAGLDQRASADDRIALRPGGDVAVDEDGAGGRDIDGPAAGADDHLPADIEEGPADGAGGVGQCSAVECEAAGGAER